MLHWPRPPQSPGQERSVQSSSSPVHPAAHTHDPSKQARRGPQPPMQPRALHAGPAQPSAQRQAKPSHSPWPEHKAPPSAGQSGTSHASPPQPASQKQLALTHTPCTPQPGSAHVRAAQSAPP